MRDRGRGALGARVTHLPAALPGFGPRSVLISGDKTFLIAAILASKHSRATVFAGALGSLVIMSVLSAALGKFILGLVPKVSRAALLTRRSVNLVVGAVTYVVVPLSPVR